MDRMLVEEVRISELQEGIESHFGVIPFYRCNEFDIVPSNHYKNNIINYMLDEEQGIIENRIKDELKFKRAEISSNKKVYKLIIDEPLDNLNLIYNFPINIKEYKIINIEIDKLRIRDITNVVTLLVGICGGVNIRKTYTDNRYNNQDGVYLNIENKFPRDKDNKDKISLLLEKMATYSNSFWNIHSISIRGEDLDYSINNSRQPIKTFTENTDIILLLMESTKELKNTLNLKNLILVNPPNHNKKERRRIVWSNIKAHSFISIGRYGISEYKERIRLIDYTIQHKPGDLYLNINNLQNIFREYDEDSVTELDLFMSDELKMDKYGEYFVRDKNGVNHKLNYKSEAPLTYISIDNDFNQSATRIGKQGMDLYITRDIGDLPYLYNELSLTQLENTVPITKELTKTITSDIDLFDF